MVKSFQGRCGPAAGSGVGLMVADALKELDGRAVVCGMSVSGASHGQVSYGLACHVVLIEVSCKQIRESAIKLPVPTGVARFLTQPKQVFAHFHKRLLYVLHSLPHDVLELNVAQRLREAIDALLVIRVHFIDDFEQ
jgi:hypothetical protein